MTDKVKTRLQELCPDVMQDYCTNVGCEHEHKVIRLAVVLRAIQKQRNYPDKPYQPDVSIGIDDLVNIHFDLEHDNYDQQSEECKKFIGHLLNL